MISVVIPVLNEEKLLAECLRSLREQDFQGRYEIIVVDDGSTDRSAEIARQFGTRIVTPPTHGNVFAARDFGAKQAQGDIIAQADGDTIYPRDWLSRIEQHFSNLPEVVGVTGRFVYKEPARWGWAEAALRNVGNFFSTKIIGRPYIISGANFAFRRETFLKAGGYDLKAFGADQTGMATQLSKHGRVVFDKGLVVATSSRRFKKKTLKLIGASTVNITRGMAHFLKSFLAERGPRGMPALKTSAKVVPIMALAAFLAYGYFAPGSTVFGKVYSKVKTSDKIIALTFDDGPNEPYTSEVLNILDSYGIKATFFVTGKNAELYPDTIRRMYVDGHIVGNHSYSHDANHALTSEGIVDMERGEQAIYDVIGARPRLYRPPHGKKSPWELWHVRKQNLIEINWNIATLELAGKPYTWIADQIVKKAKPGGIIDLHDGYGNEHGTAKANKSATVQALPVIISRLLDQGYTFVTVPEMLGQVPYN
ncbi:MAG: glycosyltransferase [Chloroflexi bacterium]|nr:glycosyltransferase [Chloroflexota bacterium]